MQVIRKMERDLFFVIDTTDIRGVKQADVVMLGFPLMWTMPDDVRENDLLWYETVTHPNGPAMTWGVFSTGWLDLQQFTKADELFTKAYNSYAREPFKVSCVHPSIHLSCHLSIYPYIRLSFHPSVHPSIRALAFDLFSANQLSN